MSATFIYITFFFCSIFFGAIGLGGGSIYTPLQILMGIDFNEAVSNSLILIIMTTISSSFVYFRQKLLLIKFITVVELITSLGSFIAGFFASSIDETNLVIALCFFLTIHSIFLLVPITYRKRHDISRKAYPEIFISKILQVENTVLIFLQLALYFLFQDAFLVF